MEIILHIYLKYEKIKFVKTKNVNLDTQKFASMTNTVNSSRKNVTLLNNDDIVLFP